MARTIPGFLTPHDRVLTDRDSRTGSETPPEAPRREARPALERPLERALLGESQQVTHLADRDLRVGEIRLGRSPAKLVEELGERGTLLLEAALERATAHPEPLRDVRQGRRPSAELRQGGPSN